MKNRVKVCNSDNKCILVDVDAKNMKVVFYPVVWDSVDSWGRAYSKKSFNRTIKNANYTFPHLVEHNPSQVIGKTIEMTVDGTGLRTVSVIANTTLGRDAFELYVEKIYNKHSFAGYVLQSEINSNDVEYVTEVALEEVTTTLFPANANAKLIDIENAIRKGNLTASMLDALTLDNNSHSDSQQEQDDEDYSELISLVKNY